MQEYACNHRQVSLSVTEPPCAGDVKERLGSLSQVMAPLFLRINL